MCLLADRRPDASGARSPAVSSAQRTHRRRVLRGAAARQTAQHEIFCGGLFAPSVSFVPPPFFFGAHRRLRSARDVRLRPPDPRVARPWPWACSRFLRRDGSRPSVEIVPLRRGRPAGGRPAAARHDHRLSCAAHMRASTTSERSRQRRVETLAQ